MKKKCLLIFFLTINCYSYSQEITGKWDFLSILYDTIENGENLKNISKGDIMEINADGSFSYEIAKENLTANGVWEIKENNLSLHYILPKKITRNYQISYDETDLILNEYGINYTFKNTSLCFHILFFILFFTLYIPTCNLF